MCGEYLEVEEEHICEACREDMPLTYFWRWRENPAEQMLWGRTYLQGVICLYFYSRDNEYRRLVQRVKYEGDVRLGRHLGHMLGEYIAGTDYPLPDYIVPVPIHWRRRWRRGYNQAEVIARGLQEALLTKSHHNSPAEISADNTHEGTAIHPAPKNIPILTNLLYRRKYTSSQINMSMGVKWENAHGTFALRKRFPTDTLHGKHIWIVDDVLTSGATAEACFDVLRHIPDIRISLITLAYVKH